MYTNYNKIEYHFMENTDKGSKEWTENVNHDIIDYKDDFEEKHCIYDDKGNKLYTYYNSNHLEQPIIKYYYAIEPQTRRLTCSNCKYNKPLQQPNSMTGFCTNKDSDYTKIYTNFSYCIHHELKEEC